MRCIVRLFVLVLLLSACAHSRPSRPPVPSTFEETPVLYPSGDITLGAALLAPRIEGKRPALVIIQGSGDSDRRNAWSRGFAE